MNPASLQNVPTMLPSEGLVDDVIVMDATVVQSADGESLTLQDKVSTFKISLYLSGGTGCGVI